MQTRLRRFPPFPLLPAEGKNGQRRRAWGSGQIRSEVKKDYFPRGRLFDFGQVGEKKVGGWFAKGVVWFFTGFAFPTHKQFAAAEISI